MCVSSWGNISPTDISRSGTYIEEATMEMCLWMFMLSQALFLCHLPSCLPLIKWPFCIGSITMTSGLENRASLSQTETQIKSYNFLFFFFPEVFHLTTERAQWQEIGKVTVHTSMFTCPSGSEGFGTCLWEKLDNYEETSSRKPRTSKQ